MKELKEFTVERLEQVANTPEKYDHRYLDNQLTASEARALAKIALAAKQAEPIAYTAISEISNMQETGLYLHGWPDENKLYDTPLYTTPSLNHTEKNTVVPDEWVSIPKEMLADYRDVKNSELQSYKASFGSHCDIPRSRWQRDLADLTEELEEIDKLIAAP